MGFDFRNFGPFVSKHTHQCATRWHTYALNGDGGGRETALSPIVAAGLVPLQKGSDK